MDDPNILDIDFQILSQIETILENKSTRESFLKVVPSEYFSPGYIHLMDNESYKYHMTTARWLFQILGKRGCRVSDFIKWFDEINLERALVLLKKDVLLEIIEQPPPIVTIQKGAKLIIPCKARSYPPPEYQWFKEEKELLLQQESELFIECAREDDAGIYICLVYKNNLETNDVSYEYSNPVQVRVVQESFDQLSFLEPRIDSDSALFFQRSDSKSDDPEAKVNIVKQPYSNGKVPQGMSISLHCEAESKYPIKYQWYKQGRILKGATLPELRLNDLFPDPDTGNMKWEFYCNVSNDHDDESSRVAIVELEIANDTTPYYASEKYAFMVANDQYEHLGELKKPVYDVADLGNLLNKIKFKVFAYRNLTLTEMKNAFSSFCKNLQPGCYVLFYFAGHGFEELGQMYLNPVDCSIDYNPQESICAEYILTSLQKENPSVNILLVDACRKPSPSLKEGQHHKVLPRKIFKAEMKNNTVFGYSTGPSYSAYESDSDRNSFFAKHLKKYITCNMSIQAIVLKVQTDFQGEPSIKGVQSPVLTTSLCGNRKLCDGITNEDSANSKTMLLKDLKSDFESYEYEFKKIKASFTVDIVPHSDIFINEIDVTVSLHIAEDAALWVLHDFEMSLLIDKISRSDMCLKDLNLKSNTKYAIFTERISNVQKLKTEKINCKLLWNANNLKITEEKEFSIIVKKITDMKLSINHL